MTAELQAGSLAEICALVTDGTHDTPKTFATGVPFIKGKDIAKGYIDFDTCDYVTAEVHQQIIKRSKPERGDTLFANIGNSLGDVAYVDTDREFSIKNVALFKPNPKVIGGRYLYYLLSSPSVQRPLLSQRAGAAQPFLGLAALRNFQVQYHASLHTQEKVASILGAYDDLIEVNRRRIAVIEKMAREMFNEWFIRFRFPGHDEVTIHDTPDGPLPAEWTWGTAADLITFDPKTPVSRDGLKPFISMGHLDTVTSLIASADVRAGNSGAKFRNGDTLFARITPCLENGKTGLVRGLPGQSGTGFGSTEFIVMRGETAGPAFAYCLAREPSFRNNARSSMSGASGRQRARTESLASFEIPIPPNDLLARFEAVNWPMLELVGVLGTANAKLASSRDLLLPRLISGELSVTQAERELREAA